MIDLIRRTVLLTICSLSDSVRLLPVAFVLSHGSYALSHANLFCWVEVGEQGFARCFEEKGSQRVRLRYACILLVVEYVETLKLRRPGGVDDSA